MLKSNIYFYIIFVTFIESKRKNVYIVLFVITTIIAGCLTAYFGIMRNKDTRSLEELQAKLAESQKSLEEEKLKNNTINKDVESNTESNDSSNNSLKIIMDYTKCLNKSLDSNFIMSRAVYNNKIANVFLDDSHHVTISYKPSDMAEFYRLNNLDVKDEYLYNDEEIAFLDRNVVEVYIAGFGNGLGGETIFFLMEDGTVEYLPFQYALKNNKFESYGKITGIKDVVKIETFSFGVKNGGGGVSVLV